MGLAQWFTRRGTSPQTAAAHLYAAAVEQARRVEFYRGCAVPDSLDGRFEMVALHTFLVLHRLADEPPEARDLAQALFDRFFADMDRSLREMGVGDMGIGRRIQQMAQGFYGRMAAYREAIAGDDADLADALRRNVYGTLRDAEVPVERMTAYVRQAVAALAAQPAADLAAGRVVFPPAPGMPPVPGVAAEEATA